MTRNVLMKTPLLLLLLLICLLGITLPASAEMVTVRGDRITYSVNEELLIVLGHAELISQDITIHADEMRATYRDGQVIDLKATGNVELSKEGDTFFASEFTYQVKEKTGLILELHAETEIEKSEATLHLRSGEAKYTEKFIEVKESVLTACELDHPHYVFRTKRLEYYPGDRIVAWHLTFWEFNGTIPLLYWPYYVFSLEEKEKDRDFSPEVGYSALTGFFVKLAYSYYLKGEQHGELYADYFMRTGPAVGFKHYYMDRSNSVGSIYAYLQRQPVPGNPYLTVQQTHKLTLGEWNFNTNNTWKRTVINDAVNSANYISYSQQGNSLRWDGSFGGTYSVNSGEFVKSENLRNTLRGNSKILGLTIAADWSDERNLQKPDQNYAYGSIKASKSNTMYDFSLLMSQKATRSSDNKLYTLPEAEFTLKLSGLKDRTLRSYLSPVRLTTQVGHYMEYLEKSIPGQPGEKTLELTEGLRWLNKASYTKAVQIVNPLQASFNLAGTSRLYMTLNDTDPTEEQNSIESMEDITPSVEVQLKPLKGLTATTKYAYTLSTGSTPFQFDRFAARHQQEVTGNISYSSNHLTFNSGTSYNITSGKFGLWSNTLNYTWGDSSKGIGSNIQLSIPYNIEERRFNEITSTVRLNYPDFKWSLTARIEPDVLEWGRMESELDWQINKDWHINLSGAIDPSQGANDAYRRAQIEVARVFHCRKLSLSYDVMQKEIWLTYEINAFPDQNVRVGSNEYNPILFDMDLGGLTNGE